jgi:RNA polymerase-binding transcription factor DksA
MTEDRLKHFKDRLETELTLLEKELGSVGRINPANKKDWEATAPAMDAMAADENETADTIEEYESNTAVLKQLETRYNEVKRALAKIENGKYGICEVSGEEIEADRLEANPAARTCKNHLGQEKDLV